MVNDGSSQPQLKMDREDGPQSVIGVMRGMDARIRSGNLEEFVPIPTGFNELDGAISGGFRVGQLALLSGPAGVGKTSLTLQIARNIAAAGLASCLFVCYEHETEYLAQRLVAMESVGAGDGSPNDGLRLRDIAELVNRYSGPRRGQAGFVDALGSDPRGARALQRISRYGQNLLLMKGSSYSTGVESLTGKIREMRSTPEAAGKPVVLFVDYLQKMASETPHTAGIARSIEEVEGLKELALTEKLVVVAIVAAEVEGLKAQRMRLQHLLASASIAYEADIVLLMNEKYDIVDRRHIEYNRHQAEQYHQYVILSVEKNRSGSDLVDLEIRKMLQYSYFRPDARRVEEHLIAGRTRE
jgi:replicative DNA helicase